MKKLIIAAIAFTTVSYASAQAGTQVSDTTKIAAIEEQDKRTPVKLEELPAEVRKTLASDTYAGWQATSAVWVDGKVPHYEIQLMRGEEKNTVKLGKGGQPIA